ncbi:MAG: hypothetical protein KAR42_12360 [candidate division Zixibacteria bacterium]|nr:hypothetical protein [candidate division Zixibacteria bacterium]
MNGRKLTLKKTGNYVIAILLFCIFVEVTARLDDWIKHDAPFESTYTARRLRTWDDEGIRVNISNGGFEKWKNNSHGFRGPEIDIEKPANITRIVCLGASESYGLYESPDHEWPAQMRQELNGDSYEVINAATVGLPMTQYIQYLEKYVLKFSPDAIVLYIEPASYVAARQRAINNPEIKSSSPTATAQAGFSMSMIKESFRTVPKLQRAIKQFLPVSVMNEYYRKDALKKIEISEKRYLNGNAPLERVTADCLEDYRKDLIEVIEFLKSNNCQALLCTYPSLISGGVKEKEEHMTIFLEARRFVVELTLEGMSDAAIQLNDVSRSVAEETGTLLIELENVVPRDKDHFADNVHYTDAGAEVVARTMAQFIQSNF